MALVCCKTMALCVPSLEGALYSLCAIARSGVPCKTVALCPRVGWLLGAAGMRAAFLSPCLPCKGWIAQKGQKWSWRGSGVFAGASIHL